MAFLLLKFILTILALFFNVLGAPVQEPPIEKPSLTTWADGSGRTIHNYGYQGDGLYRTSFDDAGVATVQFTPIESLHSASNSIDHIEARHHSRFLTHKVCSRKFFPTAELPGSRIAANGLADCFGPGYHVEKANTWTWFFKEKHVAFACTYSDDQWFSANLVHDSMKQVDICCSTCYGFNLINQDYKIALVSDASIGRTWKGDSFCEKGFKGY